MIRTIFQVLAITGAIIFLSGCTSKETAEITGSFDTLQKHFEEPPVQYSTAPFWVWNDEVTQEKIDRQLQHFKDENIDQVIIHPRPGLITEYLSDEWNELCRYAVEKAEELDMKAWLYDENSYPSGFAGGHVPAEMPESYEHGSSLDIKKVNELEEAHIDNSRIILKKQNDEYVDVTGDAEAGATGEYCLFRIQPFPENGWYGGFTYVDLIHPGVTEKFLELTMEGYEQTIGDEFGGRVPGIFTDEPNIAPRGGRQTIKWTPTLFEDFEERWGYKLQPHLVSLFEETGDWRKIRHNYYELLLELFIERWSKPWYNYTEENNLKWTGHYWEHGWPSPHHGGDNMAMYAWHQVPGIDMLFNTQEARPDQFGNVQAVKELSSVANQLDRDRTLSETYGGAGWSLSFKDMKRLGDWEYVLGVNLMNQHLSHMTLKGRRKGDYPQSFSYHAPYWDDYGVLAQYYKRLSYALSMGEQINKTLVLEPTSTAWMYYSPEGPADGFDKLGKGFKNMLDRMEKYQLEYDLGCENIVKDHGEIRNNEFVIGHRAYDLVVLPESLKNLDQPTFDLLKQYMANGGTVLSLGEMPQYIDGQKTDDFEQLISQYQESWIQADAISDPEAMEMLRRDDFSVEQPQNISGKVFHQRRHVEDGQIIFWSNFNKKREASVTFTTEGKGVSELNAIDGEIEAYQYQQVNENEVEVQFDLAPAGSLLLFIHQDEEEAADGELSETTGGEEIDAETTEITRTSPNTLTLDYLDLQVQGRQFEDIYFSAASDSTYKLHGLEEYGRGGYNPWSAAVQYETNVLDMGEQFGQNSGFTATYTFETANDFVPETLKAVVEWPHLYSVEVNGNAIQPEEGEWWLDRSFGVFEIGEYLQPGRNELTLNIQPMHILAEIEPVYLVGDFGLISQGHGFRMGPPRDMDIGPWKDQEAPYYSEAVAYTKAFEAEANQTYKVKLNEWNGTMARVKVNGEQKGIIGWPPYELDITQWVDDGENNKVTVEVVGSLKNLLGPHHGDITEGLTSPWSFFNAPEHQPAGDKYDLHDYGLLEDFEVLKYQNE
ncbi:MAG: glycosyl hydrolase [Bacteroidota bacterium]